MWYIHVMRFSRWAFLALLVLLSACASSTATPSAVASPTATATPTPLPQPVVVALPQALEPAREALQACARDLNVPLAVFLQPQAADPPATVNLRLWLGATPPQGWRAYPLVRERLVAVVHSTNAAAPDEEALRRIVMGQVMVWESNAGTPPPVALWLPMPGTASRLRLDAWLGDAPRRGDAALAPSPQAMLTAVSDDAAALGFLPAAWLRAFPKQAQGVHPLEVAPPAWEAPVLALLNPKAPPTASALVGCLQQGRGHTLLQRFYTP
jgi:hypothetical protein